jgi:hypothetical protein
MTAAEVTEGDGGAYATFRDDVAQVLADRADERAVDATARRNRAVLVALAALALAVKVAAATVVPAVAGRRLSQPRNGVDQLV